MNDTKVYAVQRSFPKDARSMTTVTVMLCDLCLILYLPSGVATSVSEMPEGEQCERCERNSS